MKKGNMKRILSIVIALIMVLGVCGFQTTERVSATTSTKSSTAKYWLKVNTQRNVVTAYKKTKGRWVPYRAMLASTGKAKTPTIKGTFKMGYKNKWQRIGGPTLGGYCYGQYVCQISEGYLFHSVWYYKQNRSTQSNSEFNKLGYAASHGCVRLSVIDAKWIYDNCKSGTKITVYKSSKLSSLGKPKALKSYSGWDPTDPAAGNPNFKLRKAVIKIKKPSRVQYGRSFTLKKGVTAMNTNAIQNLTSSVKIHAIKKYSKGKYRKVSRLSTRSLGTYRIYYKVTDRYCRTAYKVYKVKVVDDSTPSLSAKNRTVAIGTTNATLGVSAKISSKSLTSSVNVYIREPGKESVKYTYASAKNYVFSKAGVYNISYLVRNPYNKSKTANKVIKVNVLYRNATVVLNSAKCAANDNVATLKAQIVNANTTAIKDNGETVPVTANMITIKKDGVTVGDSYVVSAGDKITATVTYKCKNGKTISEITKFEIQ